MSDFILAHEPVIRLSVFLGILTVMTVWEAAIRRRLRAFSRWIRWPSNLGLVVLNTIVLRLTIPMAAVGVAALGEQRGWGLLANVVFPSWGGIVIAMLMLDLVI